MNRSDIGHAVLSILVGLTLWVVDGVRDSIEGLDARLRAVEIGLAAMPQHRVSINGQGNTQ